MSTSILDRARQDRNALEAELRQAGADIRGNAVRCPFHDDKHASGSIYADEAGVWRFKCNAASCGTGGDVFDIRARVSGRSLADVLKDVNPAPRSDSKPRTPVYQTLDNLRAVVGKAGLIEGEYRYDDPDTGKTDLLVFRLKTTGGKAFRQAHPVSGGWSLTAPAKPWPLYHRAEIKDAATVFVVEGEKCCEAMVRL